MIGKITIYTSLSPDWISVSLIKSICSNFNHVSIVAVDRSSNQFIKQRRKYQLKKLLSKGFNLPTYILDKYLLNEVYKENDLITRKYLAENYVDGLNYPLKPDIIVNSVNGIASEQAIIKTEPDILIQAGAGILRENIFNIPVIATINLHGGMAPRIRGGSSVFWALYHGRPDWMGATIHKIDKGIDTGPIFKRQQLEFEYGEHVAILNCKIAQLGQKLMLEVISNIFNNNMQSEVIKEKSYYKSFYTKNQYDLLKKNNWHPVDYLIEDK